MGVALDLGGWNKKSKSEKWESEMTLVAAPGVIAVNYGTSPFVRAAMIRPSLNHLKAISGPQTYSSTVRIRTDPSRASSSISRRLAMNTSTLSLPSPPK
jgi:hypothetical protein